MDNIHLGVLVAVAMTFFNFGFLVPIILSNFGLVAMSMTLSNFLLVTLVVTLSNFGSVAMVVTLSN